MHQNVLITSAGRRGKLVAAFQRELDALLPGAKLFAADVSPELSVGCQLAHDAFAVPRADDDSFVPRLDEICRAHEIGLVVPTIDPELIVLARCRDEFGSHGVTVAVADEPFVATCRDKRALAGWFVDHGLQTPRVIDVHDAPRFPMFAKPYDGSGSHNVHVIESASDLTRNLTDDPRMMFVEYLAPTEYDEYTLDMYFDCQGVLRCLVPRLRMETRAGEVSKARTQRISAVGVLREQLEGLEGVRGCVTMQILVHRRSQEMYAIEINPRFGGGYPLSYEAGANFPRWLIREYLQDKPVEFFDDWESDLTMLRYDDHVLVRNIAA